MMKIEFFAKHMMDANDIKNVMIFFWEGERPNDGKGYFFILTLVEPMVQRASK